MFSKPMSIVSKLFPEPAGTGGSVEGTRWHSPPDVEVPPGRGGALQGCHHGCDIVEMPTWRAEVPPPWEAVTPQSAIVEGWDPG